MWSRYSSIVLDVSRLVSRLATGQPLTGIDRVENAYLRFFLTQGRQKAFPPIYGIYRTPLGVLLLDDTMLSLIMSWVQGHSLPPQRRDWISQIIRRKNIDLGAYETSLREGATVRARVGRLSSMCAPLLGEMALYLNVGHSNLSRQVLRGLQEIKGLECKIMLHDCIPLDYPHYSRPEQSRSFVRKLAAAAQYADHIFYPSQSSCDDIEAHIRRYGWRCPPGRVLPLGIDLPPLSQVDPPRKWPFEGDYILALGTLEPRKNIELLLDIWQDWAQMAAPPPVNLVLVGRRGWASAQLFDRIFHTPRVYLQENINDNDLGILLKGARALAFPSYAEGFGLPPYEAAALGVPVVASDLPVLREGLKDYPYYLPPTDKNAWSQVLRDLCQSPPGAALKRFHPPSWEEHFQTLERIL